MSAERKTIVFENPKSTRANEARAYVRRVAGGLVAKYVESRHANSTQNAEDLAPELHPDMNILVPAGDESLKAVVKAIKLADIKNARIIALNGGNSCDGAHTLNRGKDMAKGNRLSRLITEGVPMPANTIQYDVTDLTGDLIKSDLAVSYLGAGLSDTAARIADSSLVRNFKYSIPFHEKIHSATKMIDYFAVGSVVLGRFPFHPFEIEREDGQTTRLNDLTYYMGNRMAGRYQLKGDIFKQDDPMLSIIEVPSRHFIRNLPGLLSSLGDGSFVPTRVPEDTVMIRQSVGIQADGEHLRLPPGSTLSTSVNEATYSTLVLPEELEYYI